MVPALLGHRSEDFHYLTTLLGRYRHPYGRENHVLLQFVPVLRDRRWFFRRTKILGALVENNGGLFLTFRKGECQNHAVENLGKVI